MQGVHLFRAALRQNAQCARDVFKLAAHNRFATPSLTRTLQSAAYKTSVSGSCQQGATSSVGTQWRKYLAGHHVRNWTALRTCTTSAAAKGTPSAAAQSMGLPVIARGLSSAQRRHLALWLGGCSAWVFALVVLGGVTRLTRSGLSMTEWKFTGERPPLNEEDWHTEFAKYQASPEFQRLNSRMTLDEFKFIYWMEYAHRMWGRALGLVFVVPGAYFAAKGYITRPLGARLAVLFAMGGAQGYVGWWMVRSGLQRPGKEHDVPRVSPYRLAAHLTSAFAIYAGLAWTTLTLASPRSPAMLASAAQVQGAAQLRTLALPLSALIAVTAVSGAFVAGLDAGHAYNTFPKMNGQWIPDEYFAQPGWTNMFESTAAVQLHHRILALTTLSGVCAVWAQAQRIRVPGATRALLNGLLGVTTLQVTLGIATLLSYVPPTLGSLHQANALALMTVSLGLLHSLRPSVHLPRVVAMYGTPAALLTIAGVGAAVTLSV